MVDGLDGSEAVMVFSLPMPYVLRLKQLTKSLSPSLGWPNFDVIR